MWCGRAAKHLSACQKSHNFHTLRQYRPTSAPSQTYSKFDQSIAVLQDNCGRVNNCPKPIPIESEQRFADSRSNPLLNIFDKKNLTERDICTKFITPAVVETAGWDRDNQ